MSNLSFPGISVALLAGIAGLCLTASAQVTGDLRGSIVDSSGAAVPAAAVTVKSHETGEQRQFNSDDEGRFAAGLLRIGAYEVLRFHFGPTCGG